MRVCRRAAAVLALGLVAPLAVGCERPPRSPAPSPAVRPTRPPLLSPLPATGAPLPSATGLSRALATAVGDRSVDERLAAVVADPATGATLLDRGGAGFVTPASTAKIATAVAALIALGPRHRLRTRVVRVPDGTVVLVGGGDPTLAGPAAPAAYPPPARLADLAAATARALGPGAVRVAVDATRWSGPTVAPGWRPSYLTLGSVAPVLALAVDAGRVHPARGGRVPDPALAAGRAFAALLARAGVRVAGPVTETRAPLQLADVDGTAQSRRSTGRSRQDRRSGTGAPAQATEVASVASPPVAALVERMLAASDNDLAEALAREVALRVGQPATFPGAAAAVRQVLAARGIDAEGLRLVDGSGLSRDNRLRPRVLAQLLALAASPDHPELRPVVTGLPVAGFTGTLRPRFVRPPARSAAGVVRAKTGTLLGVSSLAGLAVDADGRLLAFVLVADGVPAARTLTAQAALDRAAAALAGCGCR